MDPAPPDHRAVLAAIPAEARAALSEKRDGPALLRLAFHLGAILACALWIAAAAPLWWLAIPVEGVLLSFLFTLQHECTHATPFRSQRLNDIIGTLAGLPLLIPFTWFRYFHLAHHRHTNIPGKDPELDAPKPETLRAWLWHVSGLPFWAANIALLARLAAGRERPGYLPARARPRAEREARLMLAGYALVLGALLVSPLALWVWILPAIIGQPALRLYLLAEHGDCPYTSNMLENTRTTFTTGLVRLIAWNMPYHIEHHSFPTVPFHALPRLHSHMRDALGTTAPGYAAFTRAYLSRRRTPAA